MQVLANEQRTFTPWRCDETAFRLAQAAIETASTLNVPKTVEVAVFFFPELAAAIAGRRLEGGMKGKLIGVEHAERMGSLEGVLGVAVGPAAPRAVKKAASHLRYAPTVRSAGADRANDIPPLWPFHAAVVVNGRVLDPELKTAEAPMLADYLKHVFPDHVADGSIDRMVVKVVPAGHYVASFGKPPGPQKRGWAGFFQNMFAIPERGPIGIGDYVADPQIPALSLPDYLRLRTPKTEPPPEIGDRNTAP